VHIDHEARILEATCTCRAFESHQLTRGPCEHILSLRLAHIEQLEREKGEGG
jgi:hypothetical protein